MPSEEDAARYDEIEGISIPGESCLGNFLLTAQQVAPARVQIEVDSLIRAHASHHGKENAARHAQVPA